MKVMILGLDGATLDLLLPWVDSGYLPGFSRLIRDGGFGILESVPNMRSAAAWTTFQTGRNPGKHGILEFYERIPNTYDIRFVNARTREGDSFFKIASDAGKCVVAVNVPMTYPADEVNGASIAGLDAPGKKSRGFCWPPDLLNELEARAGEYVIEPGLTGCIVNGEVDRAVELLLAEIDSKKRAARFLAKKYPWELFITIFRSTDAAHHCFWKYMDKGHPQYNPEDAEKYGDVILKAYQEIDVFVSEMLEDMGPDTLVLVVSDHGCGPKHPASNQLNRWLEKQGLLAYESRKAQTQNVANRLLGGIYRFTIAKTPRRTKELLWRIFPSLRDRVQSRLCFAGIDWSRTRAFSDTLFPTIWINVRGREPLGIVEHGEAYDRVCEEVREALLTCRDSVSGEPIVDKVFRREEIYQGPHVDKAPDLLIRWREDIPIHGIQMPERDGPEAAQEEDRASIPFIPGEDSRVISGDHHLNGLLLFRNLNKEQKGGEIRKASLTDVAPTVLYALGLPVPDDMDGEVLSGLFDEGYVRTHPVQRVKSETREPSSRSDGKDYQDVDEEEKVKERLRGLGYLE